VLGYYFNGHTSTGKHQHTGNNIVIIVCEPVTAWLEEDGLKFMPEDFLASAELLSVIHKNICDFLDAKSFQYAILPKPLLELSSRLCFIIEEWENIKKDLAG